MALLRMAHSSLHGVIRTAAMALQDTGGFQLLEFLNMFPAQVGHSMSNEAVFALTLPIFFCIVVELD